MLRLKGKSSGSIGWAYCLRRRSVGRSVVACGRRHPGRNHRRFTADTAGAGCRHPALHRAVGGAGCRLHSEARGKHHPLACARYFIYYTALCRCLRRGRRAHPALLYRYVHHVHVCLSVLMCVVFYRVFLPVPRQPYRLPMRHTAKCSKRTAKAEECPPVRHIYTRPSDTPHSEASGCMCHICTLQNAEREGKSVVSSAGLASVSHTTVSPLSAGVPRPCPAH